MVLNKIKTKFDGTQDEVQSAVVIAAVACWLPTHTLNDTHTHTHTDTHTHRHAHTQTHTHTGTHTRNTFRKGKQLCPPRELVGIEGVVGVAVDVSVTGRMSRRSEYDWWH